MELTTEQIAVLERWRADPNAFFKHVLGATPEPYQEKINTAISENDRIAISACHDVGKSWDLARIVLWFMTVFPYSKVITTAPTFKQVQNILWAEIRTAYHKSKFPLGGKMNMTEWQMTPQGDWFAIGFTPRNEVSGESGQGTASSFQGYHAPHILVVFDEATGIPHPIWTMAEGMLTSGNVKFVAIGNPTSRNSEFFKCFSSPDWTKMRLSCFDSPNLIANGVTDIDKLKAEIDIVRSLPDVEAQARLRSYKMLKPHLLSLRWVVQMGLPNKWGVDHPLFISKVLGEFPTESDGTLVTLGSVEDAMLRVYFPVESDRKIIGVDVARFGSDATVITSLHGRKQLGVRSLVKKDTTQVAGEVIALNRELGGVDVIVVDETGIGGGVVDFLNEARREGTINQRVEIRGVQFGAACEDEEDKAKFVNKKARMFKLLSDDMKSTEGLCLLKEDVYLDELPTILYAFDSKGRMAIESKDDYKRRTGRRSPDYADSLALANFGRYDETTVGRFVADSSGGYGTPFAASIRGERQW